MELIRLKDSEVIVCISTNGLELLPYIDQLKELEVSHLTVTVNAVNPVVGKKVYSWVRGKTGTLRGVDGAAYILEKQEEAVRKAAEAGMTIKINSIILPGINDLHIPSIAEKIAKWGAYIHNCLPVIVVPESDIGGKMNEPDRFMVHSIRKEAGKYLPQMKHCARCRADAIGLLGEENTKEVNEFLYEVKKESFFDLENRSNIAVVSMEGVFVNMHLGEAAFFRIYNHEKHDNAFEERIAPPKGNGDIRWRTIAKMLADCRTLLVSGIGERPLKILTESGLNVQVVEGLISDLVEAVWNNKELAAFKKRVRQNYAGETGCGENAAGCF